MRARGWPRVPFLDATSARLAALLFAVLAASLVRDNPLSSPSWLELSGAASALLSLAGGAVIAVIFVLCTRMWAERVAAGRRLARELSAKAGEMRAKQIVFVAASASLGEEIFFRGALVPTCGIVVASLAFGLLHVRSGVAWAALAAIFGAALAVVFLASGSLVGPLLAHFAVDVIALLSARDASIARGLERHRAEKLGGLLGAMHHDSKDRLC